MINATNADNADKNSVFPFFPLSTNADKRRQPCPHGKAFIHAGFSQYGDKNGGASVFSKVSIKRNIYICVVINTQSLYPCGFPVGTGLSASSAAIKGGGYAV